MSLELSLIGLGHAVETNKERSRASKAIIQKTGKPLHDIIIICLFETAALRV